MKLSYEYILLFTALLLNKLEKKILKKENQIFIFSGASANFFFGNAVSNNGGTSMSKSVRFRYPSRSHFMTEQNIKLKQTLPKAKTSKFNKLMKPKIEKINKVKGKNRKMREKQKIIYKNAFGLKKSLKGLVFSPSDIKKYIGKLTKSHRQTFKWSPNGPINNYLMLVPRI